MEISLLKMHLGKELSAAGFDMTKIKTMPKMKAAFDRDEDAANSMLNLLCGKKTPPKVIFLTEAFLRRMGDVRMPSIHERMNPRPQSVRSQVEMRRRGIEPRELSPRDWLNKASFEKLEASAQRLYYMLYNEGQQL